MEHTKKAHNCGQSIMEIHFLWHMPPIYLSTFTSEQFVSDTFEQCLISESLTSANYFKQNFAKL